MTTFRPPVPDWLQSLDPDFALDCAIPVFIIGDVLSSLAESASIYLAAGKFPDVAYIAEMIRFLGINFTQTQSAPEALQAELPAVDCTSHLLRDCQVIFSKTAAGLEQRGLPIPADVAADPAATEEYVQGFQNLAAVLDEILQHVQASA